MSLSEASTDRKLGSLDPKKSSTNHACLTTKIKKITESKVWLLRDLSSKYTWRSLEKLTDCWSAIWSITTNVCYFPLAIFHISLHCWPIVFNTARSLLLATCFLNARFFPQTREIIHGSANNVWLTNTNFSWQQSVNIRAYWRASSRYSFLVARANVHLY